MKRIFQRLIFVGHELDILHIEFDTQALNLVDIKTYLNCRILLSSRGTFQKTTVLDRFPDAPQYLYRYVDGYHFISKYLRQDAYRMGLPEDVPTWLIEPAIDLELFQSNDDRQYNDISMDQPLKIISVSRLAWQKGHEWAIDAVARVHQANIPIEYTIVGDGEYKEAVIFCRAAMELVRIRGS